jgi:hypothetical protein
LRACYSKPYAGGRLDRLLAEGLVDGNADIGALEKPVFAERVEHLLTVIACALTRSDYKKVAYWLQEKSNIVDGFEEMIKHGKSSRNSTTSNHRR